MDIFRLLVNLPNLLTMALFWSIAVAAIVGLVTVLSTRDDAFEAGDRQPKVVWAGLLGVSGLALFTSFPFLSWIGAVITGIYWFDVRPQLTRLIRGDYNY